MMKTSYIVKSAMAIAVIVLSIFTRAFAADPVTAFINVNIVPMDTPRVISNQTVIIKNGLIYEIGDSGKTRIPAGAAVIDGRNKYLMPGLTDSHVHLYSQTEMPLYLINGVTTVFDLNGKPATLSWKKAVAAGKIIAAPSIFTTGAKFDRVRTPDEAVREVEAQADAGYDGIKIYPQVSKEEFPALMAAAKKRGLIIVGHIARRVGLEKTLQEGQSIAHVEEYLYTYFNFSKSADLFDDDIKLDESRIPQAVEMTRASGVSVIATLVTYDHIVQQAIDLDNYLKKPELKYIAPYLREKLTPENDVYYNGFSPGEKKTLPDNLEFQKKITIALHKAGVPIVAGTDSMGVGPVAGFSLHEELNNFVALGFTPYEALQTATTNAAGFLHSSDKFGTIATGKRADLLLVDGNPLDDITNASKLSGVMARGLWFPKSKLDYLLNNLPAAYAGETRRLTGLLERNPSQAITYLGENDPFGQIGNGVLKEIVRQQGAAGLIKTLRGITSIKPGSSLVQEPAINNLGYLFLNSQKLKEAIKVFELNTEFHPQSANAYDSLAEAYMKNGNKQLAVKNYEKSLELNPQNINAANMLKKLKEGN